MGACSLARERERAQERACERECVRERVRARERARAREREHARERARARERERMLREKLARASGAHIQQENKANLPQEKKLFPGGEVGRKTTCDARALFT